MTKEVEQMTDLTFGNQGWLVRVRQNRSSGTRAYLIQSQTSYSQQIQTKIQIQSQNLSQIQIETNTNTNKDTDPISKFESNANRNQ